jgi:UDP-N-acetylglucosamine 2-epimerase
MPKIMTMVGTRPELTKMSGVIAELEQHTRNIPVHSGQNYDFEVNQVFFNELKIRSPNYFLEAAGPNAAQSIAPSFRTATR